MNDNHNSGDNNHSSDLSSTHSDPVTVNEFHSVIDGCYESTKSDIDEISFLPNKKSYVPGSSSIMDSSSNNKLKNLQSSKACLYRGQKASN
ncbi:unnamed protein product [Heterobilharzia americana]|nr:unnamed protein product [Heterobilharzia americana]